MREIGIMEVGGFRVGHAQNWEAATGCTVLLCDQMSPAGLDVRGGGPASRESQLLSPVAQADAINAVLLSGGSAFGLEAGDGAMQFLWEKGIGFDSGFGNVPIVCGASLFDLELVSNQVRPDKAMGYTACQNAWSGAEPAERTKTGRAGSTVWRLLSPE